MIQKFPTFRNYLPRNIRNPVWSKYSAEIQVVEPTLFADNGCIPAAVENPIFFEKRIGYTVAAARLGCVCCNAIGRQ
jgi:hypothetical protein